MNARWPAIRSTLVLLLVTLAALMSQGAGQPRFYTRWMDVSSDSLLALGNHFVHDLGQADSALICYSIVAHRERPNMSEQETKTVIRAQNGLWHVHFFFFYDFARSYECLIKAMKLCNDINANKAVIYGQFGDTYLESYTYGGNNDNLKHACEFYRKAIDEARPLEKTTRDNLMTLVYINLLNALHYAGGRDVVEEQYQMLVQADIRPTLMSKYAMLMHNGLKALYQGNVIQALQAFRSQQTMLADTTNAYTARMQVLAAIYEAEALAQTGQKSQALGKVLAVIADAEAYPLTDVLLDCYTLASRYNQSLGNDKEAIKWQSCLMTTKMDLLNWQRAAFMDELNFLEGPKVRDIWC